MSAPIPSIEPAQIAAGDTAKWARTLPDFPASAGWVLSYVLVNATQRYTITCTAAGDDHLATATAATTAAWAPGSYEWRARVALAGEVYTVGTGRIVVADGFAAAVDARSQARRTLEAIESMLEGRASSAVADYQVAGRQLRYIPVPELMQLRDRLRMDVAREDDATRAAAGLAPRGRVFVRFGP